MPEGSSRPHPDFAHFAFAAPDTFGLRLDPALRQLLWMQSKGKMKRTWKRLSSPRRAITTGIVALLLVLYGIQICITLAYNETTTSFPIHAITPVGMLGVFCLKLLGVCIDRNKSGAGFRKEEVHRLLGGPFAHHQARLFRVGGHAISIFFTSLFAAVFFRFHVESFVAAISGTYLAMLFTYLLYSIVAVAAINTTEMSYRLWRSITCGTVIVAVGVVLYRVSLLNVSNLAFVQAVGDEAIAVAQTLPGRIVTSPFYTFTQVIVATTFQHWWTWMVPSVALNLLALYALLNVEVRVEQWARRRERDEFRKHDGVSAPPIQYALSFDQRRLSRRILWLGGSGPVIWRQIKALSRLRGGLGWLLIPLGSCFAAAGYLAYDPAYSPLQTIAVIVVLTSVFLPGLLPFDFRGDLTGLASLKMMPLNPRNVVLGQLMVPVALLSCFQLLALSTLLIHDTSLINSIATTMCFLLPINTIILALENLVFLLYPYRVSEFDMQATVRRVVMLMAKFCVVFLAGIVAAIAGMGVFGLKVAVESTVFQDVFAAIGKPLTISIQLCALCLIASFVVRLTCWAYRRFDLTEDLPI